MLPVLSNAEDLYVVESVACTRSQKSWNLVASRLERTDSRMGEMRTGDLCIYIERTLTLLLQNGVIIAPPARDEAHLYTCPFGRSMLRLRPE
jgi:hypothetical protein